MREVHAEILPEAPQRQIYHGSCLMLALYRRLSYMQRRGEVRQMRPQVHTKTREFYVPTLRFELQHLWK